MSTDTLAPAHFIATPFHPHCAECDSHIDAAIANVKAENLDSLKRWHGGIEVPGFPELTTVAHGVTVERIEPSAPIPAPRDWNDESRVAVATYASITQPGYALHVESVDHGGYHPYSRKGTK